MLKQIILSDLDYDYLNSISLKNNTPPTKFMFYRLLFLFFLLILGHPTMAQDPYFDKELKEIDSLIENKKLEIAQRKIDSLHQKTNSFDRQKKSKPLLLEIKYRQALLFDEQKKTPTKTLQILLGIIDDAEEEHLYALSYRIYLLIALSYEKAVINSTDLELTKTYLDKAYARFTKKTILKKYIAIIVSGGVLMIDL